MCTLFPTTVLFRSDRHDAVESPRVAQRQVAIVDEFKGHAVGDPRLCRARLRQRELFLRQGDAVDGDVGEFCRSEEHTSELQSIMRISYAVFCLQKKNR